ncbi:GNAT family N-acetyltransferase [Mycoplasmatota bacterium WC44]
MVVKRLLMEDLNVMVDHFIKKYSENKLLSIDFNSEEVLKHCEYILNKGFSYCVYDKGVPKGYLIGYKIDSLFFKEKGVYTPEFGFFCEGNNLNYHNILIKTLFEDMKKEGYTHHAITLMKPNMDNEFIDNGYGKRLVDVARFVEISDKPEKNIIMKKANINDFDLLYPIYLEFTTYMSSSPIFLEEENAKDELTQILSNSESEIFMFYLNDSIIGFTTLSYKSAACSRFFKDKDTVAIKGTHIKEDLQNKGYGKRILTLIDEYCINHNYKKQSTDFESLNYKANLFWPKHFKVVANSYVRYIGK